MPELSIRKIIEKTLSGEIRIPSFQRGFVWEPECGETGYLRNAG